MRTIIFATNNQNKVNEIRSLTGGHFNIITLKDAGIDIDIPEPHLTLEANASEKSSVIHQLTKKDCFGEDTGLEVESLNGEPGVKSARYAGDEKDPEKNIDKLLLCLQNSLNRHARFRTIISLVFENKEYIFEGICEGEIIKERRGGQGFGYDAVFVPTGSNKSFAEMNMNEKNIFSHRKKATQQLIDFLKTKNK